MLDSADDRLYCIAEGLISIDIKTNQIVSRRLLDSIPTGFAYDSSRKRLYVLDDTGLTAIDATQLETPELPATGGPLADGGTNLPILIGAALAALGCLLLWRSLSKRAPEGNEGL
ncbi:MAG TPA: hypothetical protein VIP09_11975 [Dehalococcoidia bacterium]